MKFIKNIIFIKLLIILIIFSLDRISKIYVINLFDQTQFDEIYLLGFLNFYLIWNEGVAFGLLNFGNDLFYDLLSILIGAISLIIFYLVFKKWNN